MATSKLVQDLSTADGVSSHHRTVETFLAGGSISAGNVVAFDLSQTGAGRVKHVVASSAITSVVVGVAITDASEGDRVDVVIAGYVEDVDVDTGVTAGLPLAAAATGAFGAAATDTTIAGRVFAIALEAEADGKADCFVLPRF